MNISQSSHTFISVSIAFTQYSKQCRPIFQYFGSSAVSFIALLYLRVDTVGVAVRL